MAVGARELAKDRQARLRAKPLPPQQRRSGKAEAATLGAKPKRMVTAFVETWTLRTDRQHSGGSVLAGRGHDVVLVAHAHRHVVQVVGAISANVYLSGLRVAQWHAIVYDRRVGGAQTVERHRLHAANATVVSHIHSRHAFHGVGDIGNAQEPQRCGIEPLDKRGGEYGIAHRRAHYLHATQRHDIILCRHADTACRQGKSQ